MHGIPDSLIPIEFHLLRRAMWHYINEQFPQSDETYSAILAIDRNITHALNASMWGYYREEIEGHEGWQNAVGRLIEQAESVDCQLAED